MSRWLSRITLASARRGVRAALPMWCTCAAMMFPQVLPQ
jgi:hypothetical protein